VIGLRLPKQREDGAIESGMRLPGLCGDDSSGTDRLLVDKDAAGLLGFQANVLVAGDAFAACQPGGGQDLYSMADGEDPLLLAIELAHNFNHSRIVPQVLRRPAAQDKHCRVLVYTNIVEFHGSFQSVAGALDVGVPSRLEIVHHEV